MADAHADADAVHPDADAGAPCRCGVALALGVDVPDPPEKWPEEPPATSAYVRIRPHTSAYVSIRQHTSAHVSTRQRACKPVVAQGKGLEFRQQKERRWQPPCKLVRLSVCGLELLVYAALSY